MFLQLCLLMALSTSGQSRPSDTEISSLVFEEVPEVFRHHLLGSKQWFIYIKDLSAKVKDVEATLDATIRKIKHQVEHALDWGRQPTVVHEVVSAKMMSIQSYILIEIQMMSIYS